MPLTTISITTTTITITITTKKRERRREGKKRKEKEEDHVAAPMKLLEKDRFLDRTIPELMSTDSATPTQTHTTHTNTSGARLPAVTGPLSIILRIFYSILIVINFSFCTVCLSWQFTCVYFVTGFVVLKANLTIDDFHFLLKTTFPGIKT